MRYCPTCGGSRRSQLAPTFYECEEMGQAPGQVEVDDAIDPTVCGTRYMDSDGRARPRWISTMFGVRP